MHLSYLGPDASHPESAQGALSRVASLAGVLFPFWVSSGLTIEVAMWLLDGCSILFFFFLDWQVNISPGLENDFQYPGGSGHCQGWLLSVLAVPGVDLGVIPTPVEAGGFVSLSQTCYYFYIPSGLGSFCLSDSPLLPSFSSPRLRRQHTHFHLFIHSMSIHWI